MSNFRMNFKNGIAPEDVRGRTRVANAAKTDPELAATIAKTIRHPWYRCQALAMAAEAHASKNARMRLIDAAFDAAHEQSEPNRIVSVASWPLKLLAEIDPSRASGRIDDLVRIISAEPHSLRRLDALAALMQVVAPYPGLRNLLKAPLIDAARSGHGWRTQRKASLVAMMLAEDDPGFGHEILATQPFCRFKARASEHLQFPKQVRSPS